MRSRFVILNFIASLFRNSIGLILGLITIPIILNHLGEEQFAIFRVLLDWFAHLSILEFGLYGAALSFFTKILGEKKDKLGVSLQFTIGKFTNVLLWQSASLLVFSIFYKYLVPVSNEYATQAWWAFAILSLSNLFIYGQVFRAYLEASQKGYIVSYVLVAQNVMYVSLAVCFVYLSYGLLGQVLAYVISLFFMALLYTYMCKDTFPLLFSKEMLVQEDLNLFRKQRKNLFLNELFGRASVLSDNIIITFVLGTKAVAAFYLTQRLAQILQQQLQSISSASWPALGELYYQNEKEVVSARIIQLTELTAAFSGITLGTLMLMNKSFMFLWTGEAMFAGDLTTELACLNGGFFALVSLWGWCLTAINRIDKAVPVFFTQALVNVIGSFVLTYMIGVNGPLIGSFLGLAIISIWWLGKIISEIFNIRYRVLMLLWIVPYLTPIICAIVIHRFVDWPRPITWFGFVGQYIAVSLTFLVIVYFLLVSKKTKDIFILKIKEFIARKP